MEVRDNVSGEEVFSAAPELVLPVAEVVTQPTVVVEPVVEAVATMVELPRRGRPKGSKNKVKVAVKKKAAKAAKKAVKKKKAAKAAKKAVKKKKGKVVKKAVKKKKGKVGHPVVFTGAVKTEIVRLVGKYGLTNTRRILGACSNSKLAKLRKGDRVQISIPTLGKFAKEANIILPLGRPKVAA